MQQLLLAALMPFLEKNPGLDLRFSILPVDPVTDILAGTGPDIVQIESRAGLIQQGMLLDLTKYVKQSNLDLNATYAGGALGLAGAGGAVYALPYYTETTAMAVNLGVLDDLGLDYPPEQWNYRQWADWSRKVAGALPSRAGKQTGPAFATTVMSVAGLATPAGFYFAGWGGAIADPTDTGRCLLNAQASIDCGKFLFPLMIDKVAAPTNVSGGQLVTKAFVAGQQVSAVDQQGFALRDALALRSVKWKYYPMPTWPRGAYNFTNANLVGINALSKVPDAAWALLEWISTDPAYERTLMRASLYPPALKALQPEWVSQVHAVAPSMVAKNVEVFGQVAAPSTLVPEFGAVFTASEAQALTVINTYMQGVLDQKMSVDLAFREAAQAVDALEVASAQRQVAAAQVQKEFPSAGPPIAQVVPGL